MKGSRIRYGEYNHIYINMQLGLSIRRRARARLNSQNSGARFLNVRDEEDSSWCVSWHDILMEIFGDTSSASLDPGSSSRRIFGMRRIPRRGGKESRRKRGRQSGCWARGPRNLLRAILPTTRRASGMGKARVSLSLSRPRNVFYSDRRWGSSYGATLLYYSFESTLDLNKSMQTSWPLFTVFCLSVALFRCSVYTMLFYTEIFLLID